MTTVSFICVIIFLILLGGKAILALPLAVLLMFAAAYVLGMVVYVIPCYICSLAKHYIERHYKIIEIDDKQYTIYSLLKEGYELVYEEENWADREYNEEVKLRFKADLPIGKQRPMIYEKHKTEMKPLYYFRLKNGEYGLYKSGSEKPTYVYDENGKVHKI